MILIIKLKNTCKVNLEKSNWDTCKIAAILKIEISGALGKKKSEGLEMIEK